MKPTFFKNAKALRNWFTKNHKTKNELWVAYYKLGLGKPTVTYQESVDQALCFGWIDGIRKSLNQQAYVNRFTPRKPNSNWSAVNIKKIGKLKKLGLLTPDGLAAFKQRTKIKSGIYSYENRTPKFSSAQLKQFKTNKKAWAYFTSKASWYQKTATAWVVSAKKEETKQRRLQTLIKDSQHHQTIAPLINNAKK